MSDNQQHPEPIKKTSKLRYTIAIAPLVIFGGFAIIAGKMLYDQDINGLDISMIPSALIGSDAPILNMPPLEGSNTKSLTSASIEGKLTLVNVFASWCIPCRQEHPQLVKLAEVDGLNIVGINYKDKNENALRFLGQLGNPFEAIGVDPNGKAAIDWGVYGIPETFLVSENGTILYKKVGPIDEKSLNETILPEIQRALAQQGN